MASKYHKNAILTGYIDSYCLVCEIYLKCEEDINSHIGKPIHIKNLNSTIYLEKYQDDRVRKVKNGYFCEFCNLLLSTATKVGLHVAEPKHNENKITHVLQRHGNSILAFGDISINEKAWNGLVDNTCAVCNMEFDNELIHKTESTHILNLIQNKVDFSDDKIYRKIDESFFQCLTCNVVLASSTISTHFDQPEHKERYSKCRVIKCDAPKIEAEQKPEISLTDQVEQNLRQLFKSKKTETPVEIVKKPEIVVNQAKKLERPVGSFKKGTIDFDKFICEILEAKDYIAYDVNEKNWCILCDWIMDGVAIETHVQGNHHKKMLELHKGRLQDKLDTYECNTDSEYESEIGEEEMADQGNQDKILDSISKFQKNDITINFEMCTAVCKKCTKSIDFVFETIEAHIEEHKKKLSKKETKPTQTALLGTNKAPDDAKKLFSSPIKRRESDDKSDTRASSAASSREAEEEAEKFAKANDLTFRSGGTKVYCRTCDTRVPFCLNNMREHIAGLSHKNKAAKWVELNKQNITPATVKKPLKDFIKILTGVANGICKDFVINEKFCINSCSFMLISKQQYSFRCEVCEMNLSNDQMYQHNIVESHVRAVTETLIITSMDSEFVRQIRPNVYHCGFCNLIYTDDVDLEAHLKTTCHRESKTAAYWRLQQYLPDITHIRAHKQLEQMLLIRLFMERSLF